MIERRTLRWLALVLLVGTGMSAAGWAESAPLIEIPRPALDNFEPSVQQLLRDRRAALDELTSSTGPQTTPAELAEAHGGLGRLYYVHELPEAALACFLNAHHLNPSDFRWHYFAAVIHADRGELADAVAAFEMALTLEPNDLPARIRLGRAHLDSGQLEAAEEAFAAVLESEPKNAAATYGLGRAAFERGDYPAAISHMEKALAFQPEATQIHYLLGMAYREQGDREKAIGHLRRNGEQAVSFDDPLSNQLYELVDSAKLHFDSAMSLLGEEEIELAVEEFKLAVEKQPDNFLYHYNLGSSLVALGRDEEGIEQFRRTIELNPEFRNGHFNLAATLARLGQLAEAEEHFERAHELDPNDPLARLEWATVLSRRGQPERAAEALQSLLDLEPDHGEALLNLATIQAQLGELDQAEAILERLLGGEGGKPLKAAAELRRAKIAEQRGNHELAIERYRAALDFDRTMVEGHESLARSLGRAGDFRGAAFHLQQVTMLGPADPEPRFGWALALLLSGQHRMALEQLEESVELYPDDLSLAHLLARLLAAAPESDLRDGPRAFELAERIFAQQQTLEHAETLAMALAELGRFEEAIDWQTSVISEAERSGSVLQAMRDRLNLYTRGEACRAPWLDG